MVYFISSVKFVLHVGHPKVYETFVWIPCFQILAKTMTTARPIAPQLSGNRCVDDLTAERNFDSQATWVIDVLDLFHDMLSMGVCTTRH